MSIWNIYQKRIDNYPDPKLIFKATQKGLDKYIFYSKEYEYWDEIQNLPDEIKKKIIIFKFIR